MYAFRLQSEDRSPRYWNWDISRAVTQNFEAFEGLDPTRDDGLRAGLFVVRRALEVLCHGIDVRSAISRGSRFSIIAAGSQERDPAIDTMSGWNFCCMALTKQQSHPTHT